MSAVFPVRAKVDDKELDKLIAKLRSTGKQAGLTDKEIDKLAGGISNMSKKGKAQVNGVNQSLDKMEGLANKAGAAVVAFLAIDKAKDFLLKTVEIRAEFQRLQALLNNTLGSSSAGQAAFARILKFAAETPFAVSQITDSFIKLANRGIVPTNDELRKLGDLTSAMGKDMDMLVEAVLDAITGEFERLKEFGIRASKQGDKVTFAFKGVKTQVKFTEDAIKDYILTLGALEGVSGSMAVVAATMGGKISNAGDAVDRFFNALGQQQEGVISYFIAKFTELTTTISDFIEVANSDPFANLFSDKYTKAIEGMAKMTRDQLRVEVNKLALDIQNNQKELTALETLYSDLTKATIPATEAAEKYGVSIDTAWKIYRDYNHELKLSEGYLKLSRDVFKTYLKAYEKANSAVKKQKGLLQELNIQLKAEKKARAEALTEKDVQLHNKKIQAIENEIKAIKKLGLESPKFLDPINAEKQAREFRAAIKKHLGDDFIPDWEDLLGGMNDRFEKTMDKLDAKHKKTVEQRLERERKAAETKAQIEQAAWDLMFQLGDTTQAIQNNRSDEQLVRFERQKEYELNLAGDNAEAIEAIEKRLDKEKRELMNIQFRRNQQYAQASVSMNTAAAIMKLWVDPGYPSAIPLSVFAGGVGGLQHAEIRSQRAPGYKDGIFSLDGKGTETSDSINARLSKNESVVHASASNRFGWLLQPMIEDKQFDERMLRNLVDANTPIQLRGDLMHAKPYGGNSDIAGLRGDMRELIDKPVTHLSIDEEGFTAYQERQSSMTKYASKRYSVNV